MISNNISTVSSEQVGNVIISDFSKKISASKKNLIIERSESIDNSVISEQETKISTRSSSNLLLVNSYKSDALCDLAESFCKPNDMNTLAEISKRNNRPAEEVFKAALNEHMNMIEALDTIREGIDCTLQHQMILFLTARFSLITAQQDQLIDFDIVKFIAREKDYIQCVVENEVTTYYNVVENCNSIYETTKLIGCSSQDDDEINNEQIVCRTTTTSSNNSNSVKQINRREQRQKIIRKMNLMITQILKAITDIYFNFGEKSDNANNNKYFMIEKTKTEMIKQGMLHFKINKKKRFFAPL
jgi:hypothetical protein